MERVAICGGCERPIFDRYLFSVLDRHWHAACIVCTDCKMPLANKCFFRNGLILCKVDFDRRFGTRCSGCDRAIDKNDLIRRARDKVFHVECFCCTVCHKRLDTGEELYILNGNRFMCKQDYLNGPRPLAIERAVSECGSDDADEEDNISDDVKADVDLALMGLTELSSPVMTNLGSAGGHNRSDSQQSNDNEGSNGSSKQHDENNTGGSQAGAKRRGPRTTIKAKQLETLKAAFAATPKPTRHIREQLAQETGLNMRVIQVWFQNRRSKERRMKQMRYGGFRPGRRNRSVMQREDVLVAGGMFPDALGRMGDPYFAGPLGFYTGADMYGPGPPCAPPDSMHHHHPDGLPPPGHQHSHHHGFMLPPPPNSVDELAAAGVHCPTSIGGGGGMLEGHRDHTQPVSDGYLLDESGILRQAHGSPANMNISGSSEENFHTFQGATGGESLKSDNVW